MALQNDLTHGNVRSHIIRFSIPLIVSNLFQALYNAVDMFFVGQFTTTAQLSAVSVSGPIMNIMIMTISGLSVAVTILLGTYIGQGHTQDVKKLANTTISIYAVLSLVIAVLGFFGTPLILKLVRTPEQAFPFAVSYLRTIFAGIVFMFGYNLIGAFQRGFGDSKSSMLFVIVAACCNIVLDYLFIAVFHMGAFGAALATVIAQGLSFIMGIIYFRLKKHVITFSPREMRISVPHMKKFFRTGIPAAFQQFLLTLSMLTLSGIANSFGLAASAGYGIGVKIDSFAGLPSDALNMTMASFASQNIGAGEKERAKKGLREALKLGFFVALAIALAVFFLAIPISSIFNNDPEVLSYASSYLKLSCFAYIFFAFVHPQIGFIRGSGNVIQTLKNVILSQYLIRIPIAFLAAHLFGFPGIAIGVIAGPLSSTITYGLYIRSGKWDPEYTAKQKA
ncbi:MATE family efflux transporter [Anaerolentibacter hominis]|uniref:MATE family efflux transporter n=1 Tax=Anaerolentibacter hominis TaxID=3079009 RepID=UPI0031B81DBB